MSELEEFGPALRGKAEWVYNPEGRLMFLWWRMPPTSAGALGGYCVKLSAFDLLVTRITWIRV
jgi:hypothetical protein